MTPFRIGARQILMENENHYNYCQSSARMVAERGIGLLKGRISLLLDGLRTNDPVEAVKTLNSYIIYHEVLLQLVDENHELRLLPVISQHSGEDKWIGEEPAAEGTTRRSRLVRELWRDKHTAGVVFKNLKNFY